ncbi:hypothetical protein FQR65_LT13967 [Abscondita terminalis]|nr:hypothetical protein FQR65_LT13967 [Abscondita terminalis]
MNQRQYRWEKKCWYTIPEITNTSQCDAKAMEMAAYILLKLNFSHLPSYLSILNKISQTYYTSCIAQATSIHNRIKNLQSRNFNVYNASNHQLMVGMNNYLLSYSFPFYMVLKFLNFDYSKCEKTINQFFNIHSFWQHVQNDINDFYGNKGQNENDIEKGALTWLIVKAKELSNSTQLQLLEAHYGRSNKESFSIVKDIYVDLDLRSKYFEFKENHIQQLLNQINSLSSESVKRVLYNMAETLSVKDNALSDNFNEHLKN